jgi:NAD-dependent dihydropyrimidine dehydrogenase PreA subunit
MLEAYTPTNLEVRYRGGIIIDNVLCIGCKKCYEVCPSDVFEFDEETKRPLFVFSEECWYCGICILECPVEGALRMELPLACL